MTEEQWWIKTAANRISRMRTDFHQMSSAQIPVFFLFFPGLYYSNISYSESNILFHYYNRRYPIIVLIIYIYIALSNIFYELGNPFVKPASFWRGFTRVRVLNFTLLTCRIPSLPRCFLLCFSGSKLVGHRALDGGKQLSTGWTSGLDQQTVGFHHQLWCWCNEQWI